MSSPLQPPISARTGKPLIALPGLYYYEDRLLTVDTFFKKETLDELKGFEFLSDDIVLLGYPKSGTTLLSEVLWLLRHKLQTDVAAQECIWDRVPTLESISPNFGSMLSSIRQMSPPRLFKTHLPFWFLEDKLKSKKPKSIVLLRNPKDVYVSYFHFMKSWIPDALKSFDDWFDCIQAKWIIHGDWFEHVLAYWSCKDDPNFLFIKYEDLLEDLYREVEKIAAFLGIKVSKENILQIVKACSFEEMKRNPGTNLDTWKWLDQSRCRFQRKGIVGDWKNHYNEEQNKYMDERYQKECVAAGLELRFE